MGVRVLETEDTLMERENVTKPVGKSASFCDIVNNGLFQTALNTVPFTPAVANDKARAFD